MLKKRISLCLVAIFVCFSVLTVCKTNVEAKTKIIKSCTINGIKRNLEIDSNNWVAYRLPDEYHLWGYVEDEKNVGIDRNGVMWELDIYNNGIRWWSYDLTPKGGEAWLRQITKEGLPIDDVESLVFDNENFVIGYKTLSGETKPILTFEEMKNILYPDGNIPATAPINSAGKNENTEKTEDTKKPENTEVSLKKNAGYTELYVGDTLYSKCKLKSNVLTYEGSKNVTFKNVKVAKYVKDCKKLVRPCGSGCSFRQDDHHSAHSARRYRPYGWCAGYDPRCQDQPSRPLSQRRNTGTCGILSEARYQP